MTHVKICGISRPDHAIVAADAGADFIGLVFYPPSHRNVTPEEAREIVAALRSSERGHLVQVVGLFVNEPSSRVNAVAERAGLDLVQLSGDEPPELIGEIERPVIASLRVDSSGRLDEERRFLALTGAATPPFAILIDAHVHGMYGGTGTVADWFIATDFAARYRTFLAGGLRPDTVTEAMRRVKPFAVDVSSGVETDRRKDADKIRAFIVAAKGAAVV